MSTATESRPPAVASAASAAEKTGTSQNVTDLGSAAHDPQLYAYSEIAKACSPTLQDSTESQRDSWIEQYQKDGMLVFDKAFAGKRVEDLGQAIRRLATGENQRFKDDVYKRLLSGEAPVFTSGAMIPWVQYEAGTKTVDNNNNSSLVLTPSIASGVRKLMGFEGYDANIDDIAKDPELIKLVAKLLDCPVEKVQLFQMMAMLKPPFGREKPWHQDKAYFDIGVDQKAVGCWIAIDEATCENGCLRFQRGGHMTGPRMHFAVRDYQICDSQAPSFSVKDKQDVVAVPLQAGGMVIFDGMIPHGTPTNTTNIGRRALQLHWIERGAPVIPEDAPGGRAQMYGGSHHGLTC